MLKGDLGNEINTIKYNPELISKVIINLKHNNGSLDFISADNDILNSLEIYITEWKMSKGKRKSEYADDYKISGSINKLIQGNRVSDSCFYHNSCIKNQIICSCNI